MENVSNIAPDLEREWFELVESERAERERFDELDRRMIGESRRNTKRVAGTMIAMNAPSLLLGIMRVDTQILGGGK